MVIVGGAEPEYVGDFDTEYQQAKKSRSFGINP